MVWACEEKVVGVETAVIITVLVSAITGSGEGIERVKGRRASVRYPGPGEEVLVERRDRHRASTTGIRETLEALTDSPFTCCGGSMCCK